MYYQEKGVYDMGNVLYYGDNLNILRKEIQNESIDLVYLDPPFNSNKDYNQIFSEGGKKSEAQIIVFEDTWNWDNNVERQYFETVKYCGNDQVSRFLISMRELLGTSIMMSYLTMMAPRLIELHRVLKKTGTLFLHCDPSASHYLKLLLDAIFGYNRFRNEIVWCYRQGGRSNKMFGRKHDIIFFYSKSSKYNYTFNADDIRIPYHGTGGYQTSGKGVTNKNGKTYKPNPKGKIPEDWWDIPAIPPMSKERIGYPTQKPLSLLERIITACSNKNDIILDPFCGCGTAIVAAEKLGRKWIGIDITHLAITTIKDRLLNDFGFAITYTTKGEPIDLDGAKQLALNNRLEFQKWALSLIGIRNTSGMKKGADGGIDGIKYFEDRDTHTLKKGIVQVKSGKVSVKDIRELHSVTEREQALLGLLITLNAPTRNMLQEAAGYGLISTSNGRKYPKIQIIKIEELLSQNRQDQIVPF